MKCLLFALLFTMSIAGCKKLVEVPAPPTSLTGDNVFNTDATAASVLTGLYTQISRTDFLSLGLTSISRFAGLSADELTLWDGARNDNILLNKQQAFYHDNALSALPNESYGHEFFSILYSHIFTCNAAIEGLSSATSLSPNVKQQLLGEAKFMRAFFYFYLANLYGDAPLALTTDQEANRLLARAPQEQVYKQAITDLEEAHDLLSPGYLAASLTGPGERVRPTRWAAAALLARVYLYTGEWAMAEAMATDVINNESLYRLPPLDNAFLKISSEAIWQLQPVNAGWNTEDARLFIIPSPGGPNSNNSVYLSKELLNSFEAEDNRKNSWIGSVTTVSGDTFYFPYKYKNNVESAPIVDEYLMVLRLGEQYLIRAEARARQNNLAMAAADLNMIRNRAGLPPITFSAQLAALAAILHERRVELFTEWGHRWMDLKRTNTVDEVMGDVTPKKGGNPWRSSQKLYPIPLDDIRRNPNLTQNPGY